MLKKILLLTLFLPLLLIPIYAQETNEIPSWIKVVAGAWANDGITDSEYKDAMQFLIDVNVIQVGNSGYISEEEFQRQLDQQEEEFEEKLEEQTAKLRQARQNDSQEWTTLSNEYDQELTDLKKSSDEKYDKMVEEKNQSHDDEIKEYTDLIHERNATIEELKQQLKNN